MAYWCNYGVLIGDWHVYNTLTIPEIIINFYYYSIRL